MSVWPSLKSRKLFSTGQLAPEAIDIRCIRKHSNTRVYPFVMVTETDVNRWTDTLVIGTNVFVIWSLRRKLVILRANRTWAEAWVREALALAASIESTATGVASASRGRSAQRALRRRWPARSQATERRVCVAAGRSTSSWLSSVHSCSHSGSSVHEALHHCSFAAVRLRARGGMRER